MTDEERGHFDVLLKWETDGIFPRIYGGIEGPKWYEDEKKRRGITIKPRRIVSLEEFQRGNDAS